jgi:hypothetical protein
MPPKGSQKKSLNLFSPSKPHSGQQQVLDALDGGSRWVLLRAGRKWRKSSLMVSWLMETAIKTGLTCPYIAPNRLQGKNIVWNDHISRILNHFKEIGFPYKRNETELSIELPSIENGIPVFKGGKFQIHGVENQEALRGISNWGAVGLDEYDDWADDIWELIIRPNLIPHQAPAFIAGTPKGYSNIYRKEQQDIFKCFHFTSYDNPELDKQELEDMVEEYKKMGEGYFRQEIMAEYERPYGTVYEEWSESNYLEFDYDPFLPLHLTIDFGVNDPTAILWIQPNKGEFRVIDYYETSDASIEHFVQVIRSKPYKKPDLITGDAAGKARSIVSNTSPIEEYAKHGIYIKTKDGLQIPDQIRVTHKYVKSVMINKKTSERLRDCIINYRYPEKRSSLVNQSNEIPVHNWASHSMRALEYYFANIDGGSLFRDYRGVAASNLAMKKKWSI